MPASSADYPRPDFMRPQLNWQSLNGSWDFLFDDVDAGLSGGWANRGLPDAATGRNRPSESGHVNAACKKRKIKVPFTFQTVASGVCEKGSHEIFWYERKIRDIRHSTEVRNGYRLLLRFGAVDYEASIWLDGNFVGGHRGGHVPFDLDLTDALASPRTAHAVDRVLTVRVRDSPDDLSQPRGKQYWKAQPESIFYTPSSGIWQSVWLEVVPSVRLADSSHGTILRSNDIASGNLQASIAVLGWRREEEYQVELESSFGGLVVGKTRASLKNAGRVKLTLNMSLSPDKQKNLPAPVVEQAPLDKECWLNGLALWSPEYPLLYDLSLRLYDASGKTIDQVNTTTGMRSLSWTNGDGSFRLNGARYFQALVLDQGYWLESGITPPNSDSLKKDIELSKNMGFNGCRKHQKVEDPIFLYWADRLGYIVWGEMANAYEFTEEYVERFNQEWMEAVKRDINHPCIVTWTPANESWGYPSLGESIEQRNHLRSLYYMTKTIDPTRSVNDNCGWEHVLTDLTTFHDYTDVATLTETCKTMQSILAKKSNQDIFLGPIYQARVHDDGSMHRAGAPVICTEFGGLNIAPAPSSDRKSEWGYITASDANDLLGRIKGLVMGIVNGGICCGFVYTQLTDIEQEANGLYTFDRREKIDAGRLKSIMEAARDAYYNLRHG